MSEALDWINYNILRFCLLLDLILIHVLAVGVTIRVWQLVNRSFRNGR